MVEFPADLSWEISDMTMETKLEGNLRVQQRKPPRGSTEGKDTRKSQYVQIYLI